MTFDEILSEDIVEGFLSNSEFAKSIVVDGVDINGILDDGDTRELNIQGAPAYGPSYGERMWEEKRTLYINSVDLEPKPRSNQQLYVDGIDYEVISCDEQGGMLIILLGAIGS